jgi:hypothetical protein
MATRTRPIEVSECDACGRRIYVDEADTPAAGFHGTVTEITPAYGGAPIPWFACRMTHIQKAVIAAIRKDAESNHL